MLQRAIDLQETKKLCQITTFLSCVCFAQVFRSQRNGLQLTFDHTATADREFLLYVSYRYTIYHGDNSILR